MFKKNKFKIGNTLLISFLAFLLFAFFQTYYLFFYSPICGFTGANIGALIALKQVLLFSKKEDILKKHKNYFLILSVFSKA